MRLTDAAIAVFARLVAGQALNGELAALPEPIRLLGNQMSALPAENRQTIWGEFLAGRDDRTDIIARMARAPLDGPLPEADDPPDEKRPYKRTRASDIVDRPVEWLWTGRVCGP